MEKKFISPGELYQLSAELGLKVLAEAPSVDRVVGVWRGGGLPAMVVHEVLQRANPSCKHFCITASSYSGIGIQGDVTLAGIELLKSQLSPGDHVLFVDDIVDSGKTFRFISSWCEQYLEQVKVSFAAVFGRPDAKHTALVAETSDAWLVFPHELEGLTDQEIVEHGLLSAEQLEKLTISVR
jgi:hypoxanthine phosphoribosyltransferase